MQHNKELHSLHTKESNLEEYTTIHLCCYGELYMSIHHESHIYGRPALFLLGVNKKITIENIGDGAGAFGSRHANGFVVGLQSDRKRYCLYFISSTGVGSGNVVWLSFGQIAGDLTMIYNSSGTVSINNTDTDTSFTIYYIPIE